jgi:hypothetical protein
MDTARYIERGTTYSWHGDKPEVFEGTIVERRALYFPDASRRRMTHEFSGADTSRNHDRAGKGTEHAVGKSLVVK